MFSEHLDEDVYNEFPVLSELLICLLCALISQPRRQQLRAPVTSCRLLTQAISTLYAQWAEALLESSVSCHISLKKSSTYPKRVSQHSISVILC